MATKNKASFWIKIFLFIFIAFEFSSCLYRAMPYSSKMEKREFVVESVEKHEHIYAINEKGERHRFYLRRQDAHTIFDQMDSSLVNQKVTIKYASAPSLLNGFIKNDRMCSLQVGDSTYFDFIIGD